MTYSIIKTYSPENGWSATFRQWRAKSHCRFLHGYALGVRVKLSCPDNERDENGWVFDFGGLKPFKAWLQETFDHKTLVAKDDPAIHLFRELAQPIERRELYKKGPEAMMPLLQLVEVDGVGCENFAKMVYEVLRQIIIDYNITANRHVAIDYVEVFEHSGNSAIYTPDKGD